MADNDTNGLKIGVLGPEHTFTDLAADLYIKHKLKKEVDKYLYSSVWEVFDGLKKGRLTHGIVPIENNIHGTVRETFDSLFRSDLKIIFQFSLPVHHCICFKKGTKKNKIKKIVSHQQALNQCSRFLQKNFPKAQIIGFSSTSEAIKNLKSTKELNKAVICGEHAANKYKLKVFERNIEDQKGNRTWFAVLSKNPNKNVTGKNIRTSIAFHFHKDKPGTLYGVFKDFADSKINMTKIESRPAPKKWGDYIFFLDFEGDNNDLEVRKLLEKVKNKVALLKNFGSYPVKKV